MPVAPQGKSAVQLDQELRRRKEALTKQSNLALRNSLITGILGETAKTAGVEFVQRTMEEKMPTGEERLMGARADYGVAEADWLGLGKATVHEKQLERAKMAEDHGYSDYYKPEAGSKEAPRWSELGRSLEAFSKHEDAARRLENEIKAGDVYFDERAAEGITPDQYTKYDLDYKEHLERNKEKMAEFNRIVGGDPKGSVPVRILIKQKALRDEREGISRRIGKAEIAKSEKALALMKKRQGQRFRMARSGEQIQTPLGQRGKSRPPARRGGGAKAPQGRIPARLLSPWMKAEETMNDLKGRGASDPAARRNHANAVMRIVRWVKDQGGEFALSSGEKNKFAKVMASNHITPSDAATIRNYLAGASSDPGQARSQVALRNVLGTGPEATTSGESLGILVDLAPPGFDPGDLLAPSPAQTMAKIRQFLDGAVNRGAITPAERNGHMKKITLEFQDALRKEGYEENALMQMLLGGGR